MRRNKAQVLEKIHDYEAWINETLKSDLAAAYKLKAEHQQQLHELRQMQQWLPRVMAPPGGKPLKTMVELGAGVHCAAKVPDTSRVYMSVGLGFHVECTLEEAQRIVEQKVGSKEEQLAQLDEKIAKQKATMKFALEAIGELSGLV